MFQTQQQGGVMVSWFAHCKLTVFCILQFLNRVVQDFSLTADITADSKEPEMHSVFIEFHVLFSNYNLIYEPLSNQLV